MDTSDRYSFRVQWSDPDDEYIARCPAFPGLSAFGTTRTEAVEEAKAALELMVDAYREEGEELPDPDVMPDEQHT